MDGYSPLLLCGPQLSPRATGRSCLNPVRGEMFLANPKANTSHVSGGTVCRTDLRPGRISVWSTCGMSLLQRKSYNIEPDRTCALFAARWVTLFCALARKCRPDTSVPPGGSDYSTTYFPVKPYHCHNLQVVGQIKQKHGFSLKKCLTKVN